MARLRVRVHIDELRPEDVGSTLRVSLMDTSMADAHHPKVAEVTGTIETDASEIEVEIEVPDGALDDRHRYSLFCHVDHEGAGTMRSGDLITTVNIPVAPSDLIAGPATRGAEAGELEAVVEEVAAPDSPGGDWVDPEKRIIDAPLTRI